MRYHLNDPLYVQYYYYVRDLLSGDWGISPVTGQPVLENISAFFPATLELAIVAIIIAVADGSRDAVGRLLLAQTPAFRR